MGMNTAVIVLNDYLHQIEKDPDFGSTFVNAILVKGMGRDCYTKGFDVLPTQHADTMQIVSVGCNSIERLGFGHWQDDKETLLRKLADDMGFRLVRKGKRGAV